MPARSGPNCAEAAPSCPVGRPGVCGRRAPPAPDEYPGPRTSGNRIPRPLAAPCARCRGPRRGPRRARRRRPPSATLHRRVDVHADRRRVAPGRRPAPTPRSPAAPRVAADSATALPRVPLLRIPQLRRATRPASNCCGIRNRAAPGGRAAAESAIARRLALQLAADSAIARASRPGSLRLPRRGPARAVARRGACGRPWRRGARILAMPQAVRRSARARPAPRTPGDGDRQCVTQPRP